MSYGAKVISRSILIVFCAAICSLSAGERRLPNCAGENNWATNVALTEMKNAGLIAGFDKLKNVTTTLVEQKTIGAYPDGGGGNIVIYRSVQHIDIQTDDNKTIKALTVSDISDEECSMNSPTIIVIYPQTRVLYIDKTYIESAALDRLKKQKAQ